MSVVAVLFAALVTLHTQFTAPEGFCKHSIHVHVIWGQHSCFGQH
jgi:hypothetical protein